MTRPWKALLLATGALIVAACNAPPDASSRLAPAPVTKTADAATDVDMPNPARSEVAAAAAPIAPATSEAAQAINAASFGTDTTAVAPTAADTSAKAKPAVMAQADLVKADPVKADPARAAPVQTATARRDVLIRAQVLLDRAHFSPGVIDGKEGGNMHKAISAFETARGLTADGELDEAVWAQLIGTDSRPVLTDYVISEDDVKGPFLPVVPSDYKAMAKLEKLSYGSPRELLAEKFHMDEALLAALNPGVDFTQAGVAITVAAPAPEDLPAAVAKIEVDKALRQVRAYGADGTLLAAYPATVGSSERPAPEGEWAVSSVTTDPNYNYDPSRLTFGDRKGGKLTIPPGPNNPVGSVWIALTKETYGIHGSPDPRLVGKTASHGCVRLTNWDARQLAKATKKGATVAFVGSEAPPARA